MIPDTIPITSVVLLEPNPLHRVCIRRARDGRLLPASACRWASERDRWVPVPETHPQAHLLCSDDIARPVGRDPQLFYGWPRAGQGLDMRPQWRVHTQRLACSVHALTPEGAIAYSRFPIADVTRLEQVEPWF